MNLPELPGHTLFEGASVQSNGRIFGVDDGHNDDAMRAYGRACYIAALEAAAARLDAVGCDHCAANVRALGESHE